MAFKCDASVEAIKGYQEQRTKIIDSICKMNAGYNHYESSMKKYNAKLEEIDANIRAVLGIYTKPQE